ncbi:MAG TPA: serine hydrolase domain-containing protein [Planctomycetota bacterium]
MLLLSALLALLVLDPGVADETAVELRDELERLGWERCDATGVPGVAIAVLRDGEIAFTLGCGWADVEGEVPVTPETVFNIGSISKCVGAWGLMKLVEEGKLALDAPVVTRRWALPESEFDASGVTLRRLLSHTAGLSLHGYPGFWPGVELPTLERSLSGDTNGAGDVRLEAAPGSRWKYSGGGYTWAQLLLEEASGRSFAEYMQGEVLVPLGMTSSAYSWAEPLLARSATPYGDGGKPLPRGGPLFPELAAAGMQTTVSDMARFARASLPRFRKEGDPVVLKPETIEAMQVAVPPGDGYGLGYQIEPRHGVRLVGHGGANDGWIAYLRVAPETGDGLVLLTNASHGNAVVAPLAQAWEKRVLEGRNGPVRAEPARAR